MSTADCGGTRRFEGETAKDVYSLFYEETGSVLYRCRASFKTPTSGWRIGNPDKKTTPADRNASAEGKTAAACCGIMCRESEKTEASDLTEHK